MPSSVNVGSLEAVIGLKNAYAEGFAKFKAEANAIAERLTKLEQSFAKTSKETEKSKQSADKIERAYKKVAASLDPVVANSQKYDRAQVALAAALKAGIINQDRYNSSLSQAKEKYLSANASTLTWREEIQSLTSKVTSLTSVMGPLGGKISAVVASLQTIVAAAAAAGTSLLTLKGIKIALTGVLEKIKPAITGFIDAIGGMRSLKILAVNIIALVVALEALHLAIKVVKFAFDFVSDAVTEGLKTQLVIDKLNKSLALNGSAAGLSARQLVEYAEALELSTTRSKEEIVAAETVLSRFDSLGKDSYPRALKASLALAKATGDTADASAKKLGPALEGNLRSLNSLREIGIVFTAGERKTMQAMIDTGDVVKYQAILFDLLEQKVGSVGTTTDKNLTRQIARAHIVMEDFGEAIASEVIPALEDAAQVLVDSLGGWENLKRVVTEIGHDVGNVIRTVIYTILIDYERWQASTDGLSARIADSFSDLIGSVADMASFMASVPAPGQMVWQEIAIGAQKASDSLSKSADKAVDSAAKHAKSANDLTASLAQHRLALEGDEEVHNRDKEATDRLAESNKKLKAAFDSVADSIEEMQRKVTNLKSAYLAATISTKAYNAEILRQKVVEAILKEENKLKAIGAKLTEAQRNTIAAAVIDEDLFNRKLKDQLTLNEKILAVTLTAVDNIAGKGFVADFQRMTDQAHIGMALVQKDVDSMLSGLAKIRDLDLDFEFNTRLMDVAPHLRDIESDYLSFAANIGQGFEQAGENAIDAGERILNTLADRFGITIDEIRDKLQQLRDSAAIESLQVSGKSSFQVYKDQQAEINRLVQSAANQNIDITAQGQKAIYDLQVDFWSNNLSNWSSALGYLASKFGGFFDYLARAVGELQQAISFGKAVENLASSSSSKTIQNYAGALGGVATTFAIFAAIYQGVSDHIKKKKLQNYGSAIEFGMINGDVGVTAIAAQSNEVIRTIKATIKAFGDALGGVVTDIADIGIKIRNDGKYIAAYIQGEMIGHFASVDEAIQAALRETVINGGIKLAGISELVASGFDQSYQFPDFEDLISFLQKLKEVSDFSLSPAIIDLLSEIRHFDELWQAMEKVSRVTDSLITGFTNLGLSEAKTWQALFDSITGRQRSAAEIRAEKENELRVAKAELEVRKATIAQRILQIKADIEALKAGNSLIGGGGKRGGGGILGLAQGFLLVGEAVSVAANTISEQTQAMIDVLNAELAGLQELLDALGDIKIPGIKGGGGKGGGQKDSVRDWIADKKYELNTQGLDEWLKRAKDIERQYAQQMEQAGKDKKLKAELIALKERELQLLNEEHMKAVQGSYDDFTGASNSFTQIRKTADDLIKSIEGSPFGNAEKAAMIGNVMANVQTQIEELSLQSATNLFGSLIGDLEKMGMTEGELASYRSQLAIIEHTLKVAHYRAEFAILQANGTLSQEVLAALGKAIDIVASFDPSKIVIPNLPVMNDNVEKFSSKVRDTTSELDKLRESFKAAKEKILDTVKAFDRGQYGAVTPEASWQAASRQFEAILARAKGGNLEALQAAPEVFTEALDVLKKFSPALYASEAFKLRDKLASLGDLNTVKQGNLVITDFEKRAQHKEVVNTLGNGFGSLASINGEQADTLKKILEEQKSASMSQKEINTRLIRLESGSFGKREIG